jgi:hypothetical protein
VNPTTFAEWKERRAARRQAELDAKIKAEQAKGRKDTAQMRFMSGRALFSYNPDLFNDGEDAEEEKTDATLAEVPENSLEESKENEVAVDQDLFKGEEAAADEEVDFD